MAFPNDVWVQIAKSLDVKTFFALKVCSQQLNQLLGATKLVQNASLSTEQICSRVFKKRENIFISGPGGCGKTYSMNRICDLASTYGRKHAITATTGIAATNFKGGVTIHSFSGLGMAKQKLESIIAQYEETKRVPGRLRWLSIDLLLIDEISMLGANMLNKLDTVARLARGNDLPMGGIQVVLSGDFLQLPPVGDRYAFLSPVWSALKLGTVEMTIPVRQGEDLPYFDLLNRIRISKQIPSDISLLQSRITPYDETNLIKPTRIYAKNKDVDRLNEIKFNELTTPIEYVFHANDLVITRNRVNNRWVYEQSTQISLAEARARVASRLSHTAPDTISLRTEAQYILTQNLDLKEGLVNGSRCVYIGDQLFEFTNGSSLHIKPHRFCFPLGDEHFLIREQLPLRLGYAVTIHSSQGMSLDCAIMDLGKELLSNCNSMIYVALSRVRRLNSLYLIKFEPNKIRSNATALAFYKLDNPTPAARSTPTRAPIPITSSRSFIPITQPLTLIPLTRVLHKALPKRG